MTRCEPGEPIAGAVRSMGRRDGGRTRWAQGQHSGWRAAVGAFLEGPVPVRIRAWDGSEAGAAPGPGVPTVVLRSRRALRRLLWEPGEMGLAHAYVSGDLDVDGDLAEGLSAMWALVHSGTIAKRRPGARELPGLAAQRRASRAGRHAGRRRPPRPSGSGAGCTASAATGRSSPTTTTPATRSTACCSTTRWPTRRATGLGGQHARAGAARQARPGLPQARPRARARGCSTSAAAGARSPSTPPASSAPRCAR